MIYLKRDEGGSIMEMSPYVLSKSLLDGNVYYNTKNNHSFFITNELLRKIECDGITKVQY